MSSLREARVHRLLTIRELARQADVAPSTVYLIEAGRTRPLLRVIRQIAAALDVEPNSIDEFRQVIESGGGRAPPGRQSRHPDAPST